MSPSANNEMRWQESGHEDLVNEFDLIKKSQTSAESLDTPFYLKQDIYSPFYNSETNRIEIPDFYNPETGKIDVSKFNKATNQGFSLTWILILAFILLMVTGIVKV